jgi:hypothetical protein
MENRTFSQTAENVRSSHLGIETTCVDSEEEGARASHPSAQCVHDKTGEIGKARELTGLLP